MFQAGSLSFHSSSYDWLVVSGKDLAQFQGTGVVNGVSGFAFKLTTYDGARSGNQDGFRIRIWDEFGVVYDNRAGADDKASRANTQVVSGGSVVIHAK